MKCMKCNKPTRFWQRRYKLFSFDYIAWHWKCQYPTGQSIAERIEEVERHHWADINLGGH